ncbi:MAG: hypothetical protein MZU97_12125 [Bacillus subtilis]|nr:hypothetical protein [Bacillus subtilis]
MVKGDGEELHLLRRLHRPGRLRRPPAHQRHELGPRHPAQGLRASKGQEIELKVIRMDPEETRINLSLKHFTEDPWIHLRGAATTSATW